MSFALKELSRLLATDAPVVGAVVGIDGAVVRVATERGAVTARTLDVLAVGDRVQINRLLKNYFSSRQRSKNMGCGPQKIVFRQQLASFSTASDDCFPLCLTF